MPMSETATQEEILALALSEKGFVWLSLMQKPKSFTKTTLNERIIHRKIIRSWSAIRSYWRRLFLTTVS